MKKVLPIIFVILSSSIFYSTNATAQQMCFFEMPDSAWSNGEPVEVTSKLNFNLVSKKTSNVPLVAASNIIYEGITFHRTYEYSGTECSTRLIKIVGTNNGVDMKYHSIEDWKAKVKAAAKNFEVEKTNIDTIDKVVSELDGLEVKVKVLGTKQTKFQTDRTAILSEMPGIKLLTSTIFQLNKITDTSSGRGFSYTALIQSKGDCVFYPTVPTQYDGLRDGLKAVTVLGRFASSIKFESLNSCKVSILLASPRTLDLGSSDSMNTGLSGFISVAEVNIIPEVSVATKLDIKCIKGKLIKKVTGANPKCPTGYKKA